MKKFLFLLLISLVASIQIKAFDTVRIVDTHPNLLVTLDTDYDTVPNEVFLGSIPVIPSDTVGLTEYLVEDPTTGLWTVPISSGKINKSNSLIIVYPEENGDPGETDTLIYRYYHVYNNPTGFTYDMDTIVNYIVDGQTVNFKINNIDKLDIDSISLVIKSVNENIEDTLYIGSEITEFSYTFNIVDTIKVAILISNPSGSNILALDWTLLNVLANPLSNSVVIDSLNEVVNDLISDTISKNRSIDSLLEVISGQYTNIANLTNEVAELKATINRRDTTISNRNRLIGRLQDKIDNLTDSLYIYKGLYYTVKDKETIIEVTISNATPNNFIQGLTIIGGEGKIFINGVDNVSDEDLSIYSINGASIYHDPICKNVTIDGLIPGIYIIKIGVFVKKVVVT